MQNDAKKCNAAINLEIIFTKPIIDHVGFLSVENWNKVFKNLVYMKKYTQTKEKYVY